MRILTRFFTLVALVAVTALRLDAVQIGTQEPAAYSSRLNSSGAAIIYDSATDAQGNVYVVGRTASATSGEAADMSLDVFRDRDDDTTGRPGLASHTSIVSDSGSGFVIKYDRDGNVVWKRTATGQPFFNVGTTGVTLDPSGNIYVTGFFQGTANFGNLTLTSNVRSNANFANTIPSAQFNAQTNAFVAMLDKDGIWQWARQFEFAVFTSTKTNVANLGTDVTGGTAQISPQPFPNLLSPVADNQGRGIVRDSDGNLYVKLVLAGSITGTNAGADRIIWLRTAGAGIVAGTTTDSTGALQYFYNGTAFLAKLAATPPAIGAPAGTPTTYDWRWIRPVTSGVLYDGTGAISSIATTAPTSRIYSLAVDNNDSIYFTGDWLGNCVATGITTSRAPFAAADGFVARWRTLDGVSLYLATYSGATSATGSSKGGALVLDNDRNVYVTGNVTNASQLRLRSSDNSVTTRALTASGASNTSFFVGALSASGQWLWSETPAVTGTSVKVTSTTLSRDSAGTLWMGGAISSGASASFTPALPGATTSLTGSATDGASDAFLHRLSIDSAGNRAWGNAVQTSAVEASSNPPLWDTGMVLAGGGGTTYWSLQHFNFSTSGRFVSSRSPNVADQAFDTVTDRGSVLVAVPMDGNAVLSPAFSIVTTVISGTEVVPPAGVYRDGNGNTLKPDIALADAANGDTALHFYWDTFSQKLYALDPHLADIKWKVSSDPLNTQRITRRINVVWPTVAQGLITHVTGAGPNGDEPKVALESPAASFNHTFSSILYQDNNATVSGAKLFSAKATGYSVLLYTVGKNTAVGNAPVNLEVVRTLLWTDPAVSTTDTAVIGQEISGTAYNHGDPTGKNGYIVNAKARFDGTGPGAAHDRATQIGPIIPVNTDEPGADDDMVIIWSRINARGIAWPSKVVTYNCVWSTLTNPVGGVVIIASQLGSECVPVDYTYQPTWADRLDPAKYQSMSIYHQPDKSLAGYNPNEEHALLAPSNSGSGFPAVFALRNDLNNLGRTTSDPYVLLRYQDATDGLKTKFRTFKVITQTGGQYFTELFSGSGSDVNDTEGFTYTFTPVATPDGYTAVRAAAPAFPTDPTGGSTLPLGDDDSRLVTLGSGAQVALYGTSYSSFFVGSNGFITFGSGDVRRIENLSDHFSLPRIAALFDDLNPATGGSVSWKQLADRVAVTWQNVPEYLTTNQNSFQIEMFFDGRIRITILSIDALDGLMGLSRGTGQPADFARTDFSLGPLPRFLFSAYGGFAGTRVQSPYPMNLLGDAALTTGNGPAYFKDRKNQVWSKSAGTLTASYFYPLQPSFWYDANGDGIPDTVTEVPWLDRRPGGIIGVPIPLAYTISWPATVPTLAVGDTLTTARDGLPDVEAMASASVIYEESNPNVDDPAKGSVRIIDYTTERKVDLNGTINGTNFVLGSLSLPVELVAGGRYRFSGLPYHLKSRLSFDPINKQLIFGGYKDTPASGVPLVLLNVMSTRERDRLLGFDGAPTNTAWDAAINDLYNLSRNPNQVTEIDSNTMKPVVAKAYYVGLRGAAGSLNYADALGPKALSAGKAAGLGYVTLVENNAASLGAAPIALHILRVVIPPVVGELKLIQSDNALDEKITLRHSNDFAGDPDGLTFEWWYQPATTPTSPAKPNAANPAGSGWILLASGAGVNDVTIEGAGLTTLADSWVFCRYRGYTAGGLDPNTFTDWAGDPSSTPADRRAQLVPGWIKRVLAGIGPFEARVKDFASAPTQTYSSMIAQAGNRFEGPVALNSDPANLNKIGLIPLYETVLRRGLSLSIDGTPAQTNDAVNSALLLAATRISDFYMLLGNEAYADAQDPTIGFTSSDGEVGTLAPSVFSFANQLPSLIEEELALLRGRDNSSAGTGAAPVYNRLFWNFTNGLEGEPVYVQNYGITDQNFDGRITAADAQALFPQGHGDAWGHYLSSVTTSYRLLRHPGYTWLARSEPTQVAGVAIEVDYLDERKFANAAAARAACGAEIVNLTYRQRYVADPAGQWQGYKDTDTSRAWGVDEWARRAGQGAYFDWLTANAILPAVHEHPLNNPSGPAPTGLQKIDRTTVPELTKIAAAYAKVQAQMDQADRGLNPLGVTPGTIPFDIDPAFLVIGSGIQGKKHFEQIYERTMTAVKSARSIFDHANELTQRLRQTQISSDTFSQEVYEQENDFRGRLVEIFGYPYAGDIGTGRTYPAGYNGPDIYHYNYVAVADASGANIVPDTSIQGFFAPFGQDYPTPTVAASQPSDFQQVVKHYFATDTVDPTTSNTAALQVDFPLAKNATASRWAFVAPAAWGQRRAPGTLQQAISDMVRAEAELRRGKLNYDNHIKGIQDELDLLKARFNVQASQIKILNTQRNELRGMTAAIGTLQAVARGTELVSTVTEDIGKAAEEFIPKVVGLASDVFFGLRGAEKLGVAAARAVLDASTATAETAANSLELAKEDITLRTEIEIQKEGFKFEVQEHLKAIEGMLREEVGLRLDLFNLQQSLADASGNYQKTLAEGQQLLEERKRYRQKVAGAVQQNRYQDMTFRLFRNEALQKYRASFDLAARYVYMAATTYDFETCQLGTNASSGRRFLTDIVRERALGQYIDEEPVAGVNGLSDPLGRLNQNYQVLKTQLGINNPQIESNRFSLRRECFRIRQDANEDWRGLLQSFRVADLWKVPEFRKFCIPFAPESAGAQPGLVIPFSTDITFGQNFFGLPLGGGDSSYDSTNFATKINGVAVWFGNYDAAGLSTTPRVYLVPAGLDIMRAPNDATLSTREFDVVDQAIPVPFPIGNSDLTNPSWLPTDNLASPIGEIRRFNRFRAYHDDGFEIGDFTRASRLVGRSVWNTKWLLISPGGTFLADPNTGLDTFISGKIVPGTQTRDGNGNTDILLLFETYGYSGN